LGADKGNRQEKINETIDDQSISSASIGKNNSRQQGEKIISSFPLFSPQTFCAFLSSTLLLHGRKQGRAQDNTTAKNAQLAPESQLHTSIHLNSPATKMFSAKENATNLVCPMLSFIFPLHCCLQQQRLYSVRSPPLPPGAFSWVTASFKVRDTELLGKVGLDAYMFLRFLRMSA
jgi:hypothetical protein